MASSTTIKIPSQTHNELLIEDLKKALSSTEKQEVTEILQNILDKAVGLEDYLESTCPKETALQKQLYGDTLAEPWKENYEKGATLFPMSTSMMNRTQSSQFLKMIAEVAKAERILEIGMFSGYSAAIFCDAKCVKTVTSLELDPFMVNFVKKRFAGTEEDKKLKIITGPALESLQKLKEDGETFDLVFIDADKANYINYYNFIMDNDLILSNGVILMDNTLFRGQPYPKPETKTGKIFFELNSYINSDERVTQVILQVRDGISFVRRK